MIKPVKIILSTVFLWAALTETASALPSFARQEDVNCFACHAIPPKLNRAGYEFRAAGYREPEEIGKPASISDGRKRVSVRVSETATYTPMPIAGGTTPEVIQTGDTGGTTAKFWPVAGSFGDNYGQRTEITIATKPTTGVNTATPAKGTAVTTVPQTAVTLIDIRSAWGQSDNHLNVRAGATMGLVSGYGAADSSMSSNSVGTPDPVFLSGTKIGSKISSSSPGVEVGYTFKDLDVGLASVNGLEYDYVDQSLHPNNNGYSVRENTDPLYNSRDTYLRFNYFLGKKNAIGGYYYQGNVSLPINATGKTQKYALANYSVDNFTRYALYGTYYIDRKTALMGGMIQATDAFYTNPLTTSNNYFVSLDFYNEWGAYGVRYDTGTGNVDGNFGLTSTDAYIELFSKLGFWVKADVYYKDQQNGNTTADLITDGLTITATYIF